MSGDTDAGYAAFDQEMRHLLRKTHLSLGSRAKNGKKVFS
jgi:hypothetical protein